MYPFERFTESAKNVLTLAQEEAERSHFSYIGTEHILLGLLRGEGLGSAVLSHLGVAYDDARAAIDTVLGRNQRIIIQQIIPTSRVKKVIEIAFDEARRMGNAYVGSEHLLLGLLVEGQGIAAHVLVDRGVTLEGTREAIETLRGSHTEPARAVSSRTSSTRFRVSAGASSDLIMARAVRAAARDAAPEVDDGHVLAALIAQTDGRAAATLQSIGVNLNTLTEALRPPQALLELRTRLRDWKERGPDAEARLEALREEIRVAEQQWRDSLSERPDEPNEPPR